MTRMLHILDTEANTFYDRNHPLYDAELLTSCYTQHALHSLIDSETKQKSYFCKSFSYIYRGIKFIDLHSVFKDRYVTSSIPIYYLI